MQLQSLSLKVQTDISNSLHATSIILFVYSARCTVNMKVPKGISSKFYDFRSEMRKYRFRPSEFKCKCNEIRLKQFFRSVKFKFPERGTREDFLYDGTFHEAVSFILAFAQCFGVMPVRGIRDKTPKGLKFRKFSIRFILCIACIIALTWMLVIEVIWIYRSQLEFGKVVNLIFDSTNLLSLVCFLELARKWPELMKQWSAVEKFLPQLKYQMDKQKMAYQIKMVAFMILFISLCKLSLLSS